MIRSGFISPKRLFLQWNIVQLVILLISFADAEVSNASAYRKFGGGIIESLYVDEASTG